MGEITGEYVYCICPNCQAVYRLPEEQVARQTGYTRCNTCQKIFEIGGNRYTRHEKQYVKVVRTEILEDVLTTRSVHEEPALAQTDTEPLNEMDAARKILDVGYQRPDYRNYTVQDDDQPSDSWGTARLPEPDDSVHTDRLSDRSIAEEPKMASGSMTYSLDGINQESVSEIPAPDPENSSEEEAEWDETGNRPDPVPHSPEASGLFDLVQDDVDEDDSPVQSFPYDDEPVSEIGVPAKRKEKRKRRKRKQEAKLQEKAADEIIADRSHPLATLTWFLVLSGFVFLLGVQVKAFFVPIYAQDEVIRPYLNVFCKIADCRLPLRKDPDRFTLTHARISLHPTQPGSIRITVKLVNEAEYAQPFPDLRITLTDQVGWVVGRRTYSPDLFLQEGMENLMSKGELVSVNFDLARPHEEAVGFEVDIVSDS